VSQKRIKEGKRRENALTKRKLMGGKKESASWNPKRGGNQTKRGGGGGGKKRGTKPKKKGRESLEWGGSINIERRNRKKIFTNRAFDLKVDKVAHSTIVAFGGRRRRGRDKKLCAAALVTHNREEIVATRYQARERIHGMNPGCQVMTRNLFTQDASTQD